MVVEPVPEQSAAARSAQLPPTERLGCALMVICRRGCYLDYPIASLHVWLVPPAQLSQMHIFVGDDQRLLGYMTWAWFDEETEQRWRAGEIEALHISEWNEGERLWIVDFVTLPGFMEVCMRLVPYVFPPGTVAHALGRRIKNGTRPASRWTYASSRRRRLRRERAP